MDCFAENASNAAGVSGGIPDGIHVTGWAGEKVSLISIVAVVSLVFGRGGDLCFVKLCLFPFICIFDSFVNNF